MITSNFTNLTSLQAVAYYTNNSVDGILFSGGMFVFFIILWVSLMRFDINFGEALTVSCWSMFTVSIFFWFAKLIPTFIPLAFLIGAAAGTLYLYSTRR